MPALKKSRVSKKTKKSKKNIKNHKRLSLKKQRGGAGAGDLVYSMIDNMYIGKISKYDTSNKWFVLDRICNTEINPFCYPIPGTGYLGAAGPGASPQYYLLPSEQGTKWMTEERTTLNPVDGLLTGEDTAAITAAKIKVFCMSNYEYIGTITRVSQNSVNKNIRYYLDNCLDNCSKKSCYKDGERFYVRSIEQGITWQILPQPALSSRNLDILSKIKLSVPVPFEPYSTYVNENNSSMLSTNIPVSPLYQLPLESEQPPEPLQLRHPRSVPSHPLNEFEETTRLGGGFSKKNKRKLKKTKNKRK